MVAGRQVLDLMVLVQARALLVSGSHTFGGGDASGGGGGGRSRLRLSGGGGGAISAAGRMCVTKNHPP